MSEIQAYLMQLYKINVVVSLSRWRMITVFCPPGWHLMDCMRIWGCWSISVAVVLVSAPLRRQSLSPAHWTMKCEYENVQTAVNRCHRRTIEHHLVANTRTSHHLAGNAGNLKPLSKPYQLILISTERHPEYCDGFCHAWIVEIVDLAQLSFRPL